MADAQPNTATEAGGACPLDAEVSAALERLKGRPPLAQSDRLQKFLTYIVEETLAGRGDKIIGYSVGVDVFGKPESFDPTIDTIVRVEAGRLRRRLADYYREAGADEPVEIVIPKGTYVPQFRYRTDNRVVTATVSSPQNGAEEASARSRGPSIAVIPFQNLSGDPTDQYFADGLTEETIANLARFRDLFVFSRSTTTRLTRDGADIRQLHDELGVDFVVEGSVRKAAQAVRVTMQLIDAPTDGHILSEQFTRPCTPDGVFEIQDEMARLVAARIADRYGPLGRFIARAKRAGRSRRWETYEWINRFYGYYATHDPAIHLQVREGLTKALEQDPESADGWAALSVVLLDEHRFHFNQRASFPALQHSLEYALSAVHLDPENAFAYQALAIAYFHSREFTEFGVAAERALELNPGHADALADIGHCHALLGDSERGLSLIERALALSPVHPGWYHQARSWKLAMDGNPQGAIEEIKQVPMPGFHWHHAFLAWYYADAGNDDLAAAEVSELLSIVPQFTGIVRDELAIWCAHDALADAAIAGWRKTGLDIR